MLKLKDITKDYKVGDSVVRALKYINLEFRESEFVSILGPSGSGKTTLLNIIGGLDHYTNGDLMINGKSTKLYKDNEWDSYRNTTIGFVFQNYYLIPHQNVLSNVEIALTISGVSAKERKKRAIEALENVGLHDQIYKKPNQLSGGQMQRVAIARALVNNPKIVLADEPTGALDTNTSEQIMKILKEISKDRLVIMVSHNQEIVYKYSTRVVKLLDGEVTDDSNPYESNFIIEDDKNIEKYNKGKKSSMSFLTALKLSFNNLKTKKARTIITSFAGSIGIIGIALVLAISNGMTNYINSMQSDTLSGFPLTITKRVINIPTKEDFNRVNENDFTNENIIYPYDQSVDNKEHLNIIKDDYLNYLKSLDKNLYNSISYRYGVYVNLVSKTSENVYKIVNTTEINLQQLPDNKDFVDSQYDLLAGAYPTDINEAVLIVDQDNRVDVSFLNEFGISYAADKTMKFEDFVGKKFTLVYNNNFYIYNENTNTFIPNTDYEALYNDADNLSMTISGILRVKKDSSSSLFSRGLAYKSELNEILIDNCLKSDIVIAQKASTDRNIITGVTFNPNEYEVVLMLLGGVKIPVAIMIYPKSFDSKEEIKTYLDAYNSGKDESNQIIYNDLAQTVTDVVDKLIKTISTILSAFAAISLIVSSIMIGIITYVSVVERTKEIGILRSVGARKKDVSRVFNAETVIIGLTAGIIGILMTLILSIPINIIIKKLTEVSNISNLPIFKGLLLIAISIILTFIAGLIPSRIAAKKDPVVALRTE